MSRGRVLALDGVRGLAVLLVTISHAGFPLLKLGAPVGVTLFFVLSGYLITGLLLDEHTSSGRVELRRFYGHRALRLLPALFLLLAVWVPLALAVGRSGTDVAHDGLAALFYFGNVTTWEVGDLAHTWSLSLEEQFYLIWPAVLLLTLRRGNRRAVMAVATAGVVLSLGLRFLAFDWHTSTGYANAYYLPHTTAWAILAGVLLAAAVREWPAILAPRHAVAVSLVGLLTAGSVLGMTDGVVHSGLNYGPRLVAGPIAAVFAIVLIWGVTTREAPGWSVHPVTVFFGAISYGLYLWHGTLIGLVESVTGSGDFVHLAVGSGCAVAATAVAWASHRWVETPFLRLKDRDAPESHCVVSPSWQ